MRATGVEEFPAPAGCGVGAAGPAVGSGASFVGVNMAVNAIFASTEFLASGSVTTDAVESGVVAGKDIAGAGAFDLGSVGGGVTAVGNAGIVTTGVTVAIRVSETLRGCLRGACAA